MGQLERAIAIAAEAHAGQTDKAGAPYILHPLRVMMAVSAAAKECAVLHDVVEDCPAWPMERLAAEGFHPIMLSALDAVTKRDGEDYESYLARVETNAIAREVKLADLRDNMDASRGAPHSEKREAKYRLALAVLTDARSSAGG
jgi:(p)ppGpp synthase/HD superfamily hydrolase